MELLTQHAIKRTKQRGILMQVAKLVWDHGDVERFAGAGCTSLSLSQDAADELIAEGTKPTDVEAARKIVLVVEMNEVITALRDCGPNGRRYRKQYPTRKRHIADHRIAA
jgi:hypothetical protein